MKVSCNLFTVIVSCLTVKINELKRFRTSNPGGVSYTYMQESSCRTQLYKSICSEIKPKRPLSVFLYLTTSSGGRDHTGAMRLS